MNALIECLRKKLIERFEKEQEEKEKKYQKIGEQIDRAIKLYNSKVSYYLFILNICSYICLYYNRGESNAW